MVNTGDASAKQRRSRPLLDDFGRLFDVPGVFVFGSNDYTAAKGTNPLAYLARSTSRHGMATDRDELPTEELRAGLSSGAWKDLTGRRTTLDILGTRIEFRGADDAHLHHDDYALVAGPAAADADLSIGVTHAPYRRVLDAMTATGCR